MKLLQSDYDKRIKYSFIFFIFLFSLFVYTNYNYHFPNDGVKYFFDSQILLEKFNSFFALKNNNYKNLTAYFNDLTQYNDNFFSPQSGIVVIIFVLRFILGELWIVGYIITISLLNAILYSELFKIKKIFNLTNISFIILLLLVFSNFEYLKVSKSYYNEALYIPILNIFIINFIDYCFSTKNKKNFNSLLIAFLLFGILFRLQHVTLIATLIFFYYFKKKSIKKFITISFFTLIIGILGIIFYLDLNNNHDYLNEIYALIKNDLSIFVSFSNINKYVDSSYIKNFYLFYFFLILIISIIFLEIKNIIKISKRFVIFITTYLTLNIIFIFFLTYNDERYYLNVYFLLSLLLVSYFDRVFLKKKYKMKNYLLVIFTCIFVLKTVVEVPVILKQYANSRTSNTIDILNSSAIVYENLQDNSIYLCEVPRICIWSLYNKKQNVSKIFKFKENFSFYDEKKYLYIGNEDLIINFEHKIIVKKSDIVVARLISKIN
jgi:hypothetical protein